MCTFLPVPSVMWFLVGVGLIASFFPGHMDLSTKTLLRHPIGQNVPSAVSSQLISATDKQQYAFFFMVCKLQGKSILSDNMWL